MKQLLFVHGGDSLKPGENFYEYWDGDQSWLSSLANPFLEAQGKKKRWKDDLVAQLGGEWVCVFPRMPNDMDAHYAQWKWFFDKHLPFMEDGIVLVGHSLGGNFLAKYLAENTLPVRVSQLHIVAPSWSEGDFVLPASLGLVVKQVENIFVYGSVDDPVVRWADIERYAKALPGSTMVSFQDRGHFLGETFPELVANIQASI